MVNSMKTSLHSSKVLSQHPQLTIWSKPEVETVLADLTNLQSFKKQSLLSGNLVKTTKRTIQYWQHCFSSEFCSVWRSFVVANFLSVENWTSISTVFFFFILFLSPVSYRRPESLSRPDAQYCRVVTVLIRVYSRHLHFRHFQGKFWRNASAHFRKLLVNIESS